VKPKRKRKLGFTSAEGSLDNSTEGSISMDFDDGIDSDVQDLLDRQAV